MATMTGSRETSRTTWLAVSTVSALAFAIRWFRADEAFGGFHSFNEAWYSTVARNYDSISSLFFPISPYGKIDFNVSPFFSWLLFAAGSVSGFDESTLRFVPIIFSVLTIPVIYVIGRRFFGVAGGFCAAAFYAFAPVSVMVGRNVQTDAVYIFFMLLSLVFYLRYRDDDLGISNMAISGFLFGIGFLTKQFAAIILPAIVVWEIFRERGIKWFGWGHLLFGLCALCAAGPYFIYHIVNDLGAMAGSQSSLSASQFVPLSIASVIYLLPEYFWGLSPFLAVLSAIAFVYYIIKRNAGGRLALAATIFFNWFFLHWHGHSYYLLFAAPFLCLMAGGMIGSIKNKTIVAALASVICALSLIQAVAMLCEVKYGFSEFPAVAEVVSEGARDPLLIAADGVAGSYYPVLKYYAPEIQLITEKDIVNTDRDSFAPQEGVSPYIVGFVPDDVKRFPPLQLIVKRKEFGLFIFGYRVRTIMMDEHFFMIEDIKIKKNADPLAFGVYGTGYVPSLTLGVIPPGGTVPIKDGRIDFRRQ